MEQRGNAPRAAILQGSPALLCLPRWCAAPSRVVRQNWWSDGVTLPARRSCKDQLHTCARPIGARTWFRATLSCSSNRRCHQISFPGHSGIGADAGNRNRAFGVALRNSTFELHPHGGKWRESNFLPQRDGVYSAATAPAVLKGTSQVSFALSRA